MKYYLICQHPCGDILVRNAYGQMRWFKPGTYIVHKDGSITPKQKVDKSH